MCVSLFRFQFEVSDNSSSFTSKSSVSLALTPFDRRMTGLPFDRRMTGFNMQRYIDEDDDDYYVYFGDVDRPIRIHRQPPIDQPLSKTISASSKPASATSKAGSASSKTPSNPSASNETPSSLSPSNLSPSNLSLQIRGVVV